MIRLQLFRTMQPWLLPLLLLGSGGRVQAQPAAQKAAIPATGAQKAAIPAVPAVIQPTTPPLSLELSLLGIKGAGALQAAIELTSDGKPLGTVRCDLFSDKAPQAVAAFVGLARGLVAFKDPHTSMWKKQPFYDRLPIHRVIADFLIQSGDPKCSEDAQCMFSPGSGDPGFALPDEARPELRFDQGGVLALADRGPGTAGSQFFITVRPAPWLTGHHTIFGQCDNLPLIEKLSQVETHLNDVPKTPVVIAKLTILRKPK